MSSLKLFQMKCTYKDGTFEVGKPVSNFEYIDLLCKKYGVSNKF